MPKVSLAAIAAQVLLASAAGATAQPGSSSNPIPLKMKRGTDTIVVRGVLRQNVDCCAYVFKAAAGQQLHWTESGAVARMGIEQPDGQIIDPGLPNPADLPLTGTYKLLVTPDLMAEGAFGPFALRLRIPPPGR
jgi:hypothetical protein